MELKPQDLVVALKVLTKKGAKWNQRELSQSLGMSLSEVNGAIKRATKAGLMVRTSKNEAPQSVPYALQEFIQHGVRYAFPLEKGSVTRGIPSGMVGAQLESEHLKLHEHEIPVWPSPQGKVRGVGIRPLYRSIPDIVEKEENKELYRLLSLVDMIREGRTRERNLASDMLAKRIGLATGND
jgi:hypothetical protein